MTCCSTQQRALLHFSLTSCYTEFMKKTKKVKPTAVKQDAVRIAIEHQTKIAWTFVISAAVLALLHFSLSTPIFMLSSSLQLLTDDSIVMLSFASAAAVIVSSLLALYYFAKRNDTVQANKALASKKKGTTDIYQLIQPDMKSWKYLFVAIWFTYYATMMVPFISFN